MKIACIVGTRPNFIKAAPIIAALKDYSDALQPVLVHTGQHRDANLSDIFFRELQIPTPHYQLRVGHGTPAQQTSAIIERFDPLCKKEQFSRVLVIGDVTSTLACSITAAKRCIPVDHVEAGLRSFDRTMPEEINRILTDSIAELCFVSENSGVNNLQREGHSTDRIKLVGNVLIDSLQTHRNHAAELNKCRSFGLKRNGYALVTLHRPSNVDDHAKLAKLIEGLEKISKIIPAIFPVHPRTRTGVGNTAANGSLTLCEPLGYLDFLSLMCDSKLVITDSGGIQEETTALGIPCLTMRHNTERPSTTELGTNTLVGQSLVELEKMVSTVLAGTYKKGSRPELWDGKASERIARILSEQS